MEEEKINELYKLIDNIPITSENEELIEEIKNDIENKDYTAALEKIEKLGQKNQTNKAKTKKPKKENEKINKKESNEEKNDISDMFPKKLSNKELERKYIRIIA